MYGHKLPVLCLDISYDSSLLITGSADRNVKIWGMDFGDCHKSIFAHDDRYVSRNANIKSMMERRNEAWKLKSIQFKKLDYNN